LEKPELAHSRKVLTAREFSFADMGLFPGGLPSPGRVVLGGSVRKSDPYSAFHLPPA